MGQSSALASLLTVLTLGSLLFPSSSFEIVTVASPLLLATPSWLRFLDLRMSTKFAAENTVWDLPTFDSISVSGNIGILVLGVNWWMSVSPNPPKG